MKPSFYAKNIIIIGLVSILFLSFLMLPSYAEQITNQELGVSVDVSFSNGDHTTGSVSGSTITASAEGYKASYSSKKATQTVTITNNSGEPLLLRGTISLTFLGATAVTPPGYSIKNNGSNLDSDNYITNDNPRSYSKDIELADGTSLVISITSPRGSGSVTISYTPTILPNTKYTVTYTNNAEFGSYTVDGGSIPEPKMVSVADGTALVVTPVDGYTCVGFVDTKSGNIIDGLGYDGTNKAQKTTLFPSSDCTIAPVYVKTADVEALYSVKGQLYYTWESAAIDAALSKDTMILLKDHTLSVPNDQYYGATVNSRYVTQDSSGIWNYTVPAGATFLVPFNSTNTLYTATPGTAAQGVSDYAEPVYAEDGETILSYNMHYPTQYRKLTISSGVNVNVEGGMSISGMQSHQQGYNGCPVGPQGFVELPKGAKITVKAGGTLYAWGYIVGTERKTSADPISEGTVEVLNGGTVYECFQVLDWRGGTATSPMVEGDNPNGYKVFPISQYAIQNIQVPLTLNAGANEIVAMSIDVSLVGNRQPSFKFVGLGGFISTDDKIVKDYDENTDQMVVSTYGNISVSPIEITVNGVGSLGTTTLRSREYNMPLPGHMTIHIMTGSVSITQDVVMLPGFKATIAEGTTLKTSAGCNLIAYDADQWGAYTGPGNSVFKVVPYAYSRIGDRYKGNGIAEKTDLEDAMLLVNGTLDLSNSYLYTTTSGANICSTGNGIVKTQIGTMTVTKQASQSGTSISYVDIPLTSAKLHNANPSTPYTETATGGAGTYYYCLRCGMWKTDNTHTHSDSYKTNVSLADNLYMHFAFPVGDASWETYTATVTHVYADGTIVESPCTLSEILFGDVKYCKLVYAEVAAKEMVDAIYVTVKNGNTVIAFWGDSIRAYGMRLLTTYSNNVTLRKAVVDMLNYGASCQTYFGYNTGSLANNLLNDTQKGYASTQTYKPAEGTSPVSPDSNANTCWNATQLVADSNIWLRIAFDQGVKAGMKYSYSFSGHKGNEVSHTTTYTIGEDDFVTINGINYFYGIIDKLVTADAAFKPKDANGVETDFVITVTVYNADGSQYGTFMESPLNYVSRFASSEGTDVYTMLMRFSESALAYLHGNEVLK